MKTLQLLLTAVLLLTFSYSNAQKIVLNEATYNVKGTKIYENGKDVTDILTEEKRNSIFSEKEKMTEIEMNKEIEKKREKQNEKAKEKLEKGQEKKEKAQKNAEKDKKRAEKKQKQAEKALKKKEKAQSTYEKETAKLKSAQKKYDKLKGKGKLSPVDETKWLKKIETQRERILKAEQKL